MIARMHEDWDAVSWAGYESCVVGVCVPSGPLVYDLEK